MELDKIEAAKAYARALSTPEWGTKRFKAGAMTRQTLADFAPFEHIHEVRQLTGQIRRREPVDGLMLHYLKRRYPEQEPIGSPDDLNRWFEQVLQDQAATFIRPKSSEGRFLVYSEKHKMLAVIDRNGQRVSVHKHDGSNLGELWIKVSELTR